MTKRGFTLMELLVSIFITGMVMLSLVAMWKTSSNQTAQAQRQSIIRNESTIFLRKIYADFVSASEILCPWGYTVGTDYCSGEYSALAVKEAVLKPDDPSQLVRITDKKLCNNVWATESNLSTMSARCIKPSYVAYKYDSDTKFVYRCSDNFLDGDVNTISISDLKSKVTSHCTDDNWEIIMPYVDSFHLSVPSGSSLYPELLIDYTIKREFAGDIPPVYFKFKRSLTRKRGV